MSSSLNTEIHDLGMAKKKNAYSESPKEILNFFDGIYYVIWHLELLERDQWKYTM